MRQLISHNSYVSLQFISEKTAITSRTLRRDIADINEKLADLGINISGKSGRGITIKFSDAQAEIAARRIFSTEIDDFSSNFRMLKIASDLLMLSPKSSSISELADKYFISRASIVNDLKTLEVWLHQFNLTLLKSRVGTSIKGSDQNIRMAMKALVLKSIYNRQDMMESRLDESTLQELSEKFGQQAVHFTLQLINFIEQQLHYTISDPYYINLFTHILVLIHRSHSPTHRTDARAVTMSRVSDHHAWQVSLAVVERIETACNTVLVAEESHSIYQYLVSSGKAGGEVPLQDESLISERETRFAQELISRVAQRINIEITTDQNLQASLSSHIKPMLNRLRYHIRIKNPLLHDIQTELGTVFAAVKAVINQLTQEYSLDAISDDEVAYLTVHIQAAIENSIKVKRVLLVCSSGLGTSQLLYGRIIRAFPDWKIIDIVPGKNIADSLKRHECDVVISTIRLEPLEKPVVYVSALFSAKDITRVTECLVSNSIN
ncbi:MULTISPECIES: transcription antiterminator [unclassified Pantoea]|uniref:BglG family transcription antiterminator n=1 Tax=unclassified Pantoea TaxID=2630326 RepID=UPI0023DB0D7A|nr:MULTISPECIES: transcription antiterminator [unclassified Pantoea]MDF2044348.1 transcription antiterminator [Pantoea sp. Cr_R14]MDF2072279.1 transcription antiterminator [Pantoea sp. Cr_R13]MDF2081804.1 transcription antiterminator [Pantoea sp. Cr_R21]